jgi:hypothetical protein
MARTEARHPGGGIAAGREGEAPYEPAVTSALREARPRGIEIVPVEVIQDIPALDVTKRPKIKEVLP